MVETSQWFSSQLSSSAEGFAWSARQVPLARLDLRPPEGLGEWPAVCHVFHLLFYEQTVACRACASGWGIRCLLSRMKTWPDGQQRIEELLPAFAEIRSQQIALLPQFDEADWKRDV